MCIPSPLTLAKKIVYTLGVINVNSAGKMCIQVLSVSLIFCVLLFLFLVLSSSLNKISAICQYRSNTESRFSKCSGHSSLKFP